MLMVFKMVSPNVRVISVGRAGARADRDAAVAAFSTTTPTAWARQVSRARPGHTGPNLIYITLYGRRWQDFGGDLYFGDFQKTTGAKKSPRLSA